jgi:hypothetical protein
MSPEQASGKVADNRSDVWSFGVVFWEMITGAKLFDSETVSHTLADVLRSPIDFTKIPGSTPSAILELLKRCLDRDVKTRLQAIGEARIAIAKYLSGPRTAIQVPQTKTGNLSKGVWAVSAVLAIVAAALAVAIWAPWRPAPDAAKPVRFQIAPPAGVNAVGAFSLSPDGTKLVYFGSGSDGALRLWVRAMDTLESRPLMGTEGVSNAPVFWSPDSQFIAFSAEGKLKKIDATGSPPETICDVPGTGTVLGGSWNRGGVIVFGLNNASGIQRVSSAGGAPLAVTAVNARQPSIHLAPVFLPDGRHFLYLVNSSPEDSGIYIGSIDSRPDHQNPKRLVATTFGAAFVSSPAGNRGTILFDREGTLLAQQFDPGRLETIGELVQVAEGLGSFLGFGYFSASNQGTLAYRGGANGADMQLTWFDRQGKNLGVVDTRHDYRDLSLSPDGTRVAATRAVGNNRDIWLTALSRGSETRFTFDPGLDLYPIWSSDGSQIVFSSNRSGSFDLYYHAANGSGKDELLLKSDHNKAPTDFSADGRFLLYDDLDPKTKRDLWVLPMEGAPDVRKPVPFLRTGFNEQNAKFSLDRHWVAYQSDQSGRFEIYVRPFPEAGGGEWLVSQGAGPSLAGAPMAESCFISLGMGK